LPKYQPELLHDLPDAERHHRRDGSRALWPGYNGTGIGCFASSQASLPIRLELANGAFLTSMAGYG
jgi:hypothetical protein